jgi:uncharacterized spore protein YtfJ
VSMSEFDLGATVGEIVGGMVRVAESVKVIGEPIEAAGKTIIPAVVARLGFGAGGGVGGKVGEEGEPKEQGQGAGGGGGMALTPIFLVVDAEGERLITMPGAVDIATAVVGRAREALDRVMPRRGRPAEEEAQEEA